MPAMVTNIESVSAFKISRVNHFVDIFNNGITDFNTGIKSFVKYSYEYNTIKLEKRKAYPSRLRGRGVEVRVSVLF